MLAPGFPANEQDSTCLPAQQLMLRSLQVQFPFYTIIIFALHYPYRKALYQWNSLEVIAFNGQNKRKLAKLLLWKNVWIKMQQLQRQKRIDGILSFWCTECALLGHYFGRIKGIRHYCWILGQDAKEENSYVRFIRPMPEELIALSPFLKAEFHKNHGIRPAYCIPNGVDDLPDDVPGERNIDLLAAGSLIPLKQYHLLVDVASALKKKYPQLKIVLCGKGNEEGMLRRLITDSGYSAHFRLLGELPHEQVLQLMRQARIFIHPSRYEGFSTVCLEALQAGAHVISFCNPVEKSIPQWHIVTNVDEMIQVIDKLLSNSMLLHSSVIPYRMSDSALQVGELFS